MGRRGAAERDYAMGGRIAGATGAEGTDFKWPNCATQPCSGAASRVSLAATNGAWCRQPQVQDPLPQQSIGAGSGWAGVSTGMLPWQSVASLAPAPIWSDIDAVAWCAEWSIAAGAEKDPTLAIRANTSNQ